MDKPIVRLDLDDWWPAPVRAAVERHADRFRRTRSLEELLSFGPIRSIAYDLEASIREMLVVGYHCTKEPSTNYYETRGLRVLSREDHQREFLEQYSDLFSKRQLEQLRAAWLDYFPGEQDREERHALVLLEQC